MASHSLGQNKSKVANALVELQREGMVRKFVAPNAKKGMWYLTPKGAKEPEKEETGGYRFH